VPGQVEEEATVAPGEKINSIHCFEFLDNAVEVCNFLNKPKGYLKDENGNLIYGDDGMPIPDPDGGLYTYEETWYNTFKDADGDSVPGWSLGFESRYPEDRIGYHDADMLYPLASWLNELYNLKNSGETAEEKAANRATANTRFKNEYERFFNKDFLLTYYLITEALLMADSRTKNMMIATWGKEERTYIDANGERQTERNYIWYPIFYDMDTMLGLDNTGAYRFSYYAEDSDETVYNGKEVLWNFVRDCLRDDLRSTFNELEANSLNEDVILNYIAN